MTDVISTDCANCEAFAQTSLVTSGSPLAAKSQSKFFDVASLPGLRSPQLLPHRVAMPATKHSPDLTQTHIANLPWPIT